MADYTITLPDGTCIKGENPIDVVHMAQMLRETDEDDSETLQERVDEAFADELNQLRERGRPEVR